MIERQIKRSATGCIIKLGIFAVILGPGLLVLSIHEYLLVLQNAEIITLSVEEFNANGSEQTWLEVTDMYPMHLV